jgi:hypothetical protein
VERSPVQPFEGDDRHQGKELRSKSGKAGFNKPDKGNEEAQKSNHKLYGSAEATAQALAERAGRGRGDWTKGQRKEGVKREEKRSASKKSTKILLTGKCDSHDTLVAPVTVFPL